MIPKQPTVYTVGHGDRSLDELVALLRDSGIDTLVDVRSHPHSRRFPQFDEASLRTALEAAGIAYDWAGQELGGLREAAGDSPHEALPEGLRGFADLMAKPAFEHAMSRLVELAGKGRLALMCAERDPLRCHRSLIADWLLVAGYPVVHLIEPGVQQPHQLRPEARREAAGLVYDRVSDA